MIESRKLPSHAEIMSAEIRKLWEKTGATTFYCSMEDFQAAWTAYHCPVKLPMRPSYGSSVLFSDFRYSPYDCITAVIVEPSPWCGKGYISCERPEPKPVKKVCDPMSRHIGNCGAEDCPIIAPRKAACSHPIFRREFKSAIDGPSYCYDCREYLP